MYKRGDVVTLEFPYKENRTITKRRPVVILEIFVKDECYVCKVTKTNRSGQLPGKWVLKDSPDGKIMGLDNDSFVSSSDTITVKMGVIKAKIGECPFIEEIDPS